jgi:hypothetical protein
MTATLREERLEPTIVANIYLCSTKIKHDKEVGRGCPRKGTTASLPQQDTGYYMYIAQHGNSQGEMSKVTSEVAQINLDGIENARMEIAFPSVSLGRTVL